MMESSCYSLEARDGDYKSGQESGQHVVVYDYNGRVRSDDFFL